MQGFSLYYILVLVTTYIYIVHLLGDKQILIKVKKINENILEIINKKKQTIFVFLLDEKYIYVCETKYI